MKPRILFLVGPTAVGKTHCALWLAKKLKLEVISCDSMQVYRGMEILASMPTAADRTKVPHHLIAVVSPEKEFNVSQYRDRARKKIEQIHKRRRLPFFVGGSGLYMSVVIDGIFDVKAQDQKIRETLYRQARKLGSFFLHERLTFIDPQAAAKIHPNDTRRIVRALEVFEITGKPISQLQATRRGLEDSYDIKIFGMALSRKELDRRINARVDDMFSRGLLNEVRKLLKKKLSKTARYAIGISEIQGYLTGAYDLNEAREMMKRNTRRYARRQMTWFKKDKRIIWVKNGKQLIKKLKER